MGDPSSSNTKHDWKIDFEEALKVQPILFQPDAIFPVAQCLKNEKTEKFYHPKEIIFGPLHFKQEDFQSWEHLEFLKSEVARKINGSMKDDLSSAVQYLNEHKRKDIRNSYGWLPVDTEILTLLLVRDACFVLEVLESFSENPRDDGKAEKTTLEIILNRKNHHPLLNEIVKDMFKLENQLPLWVLNEIRTRLAKEVNNWFEHPLKDLSPVEIEGAVGTREYSKRIHILQLLGEYMVDNPVGEKDLVSSHNGNEVRRLILFIFFVLIFLTLSPFFILWFLWLVMFYWWESYQIYVSATDEVQEEGHVLPLGELDRLGVKIKKLKGKGISHIKFDESDSTLYLPKFRVDDRSEVILRNLMAMEVQMEDSAKPITRYAVLMNDLVNTSEDVAILRQHGIITNSLGSDNDVAQLWNSIIIPSTGIPSYVPIKEAAEKLNLYKKSGGRFYGLSLQSCTVQSHG